MIFSVELQQHLHGRALLQSEIPFSASVIFDHVTYGYVKNTPGIQDGQCQRCGNIDPFLFALYPCYQCQRECQYCRNCIMMGRVSVCTQLYTWCGEPPLWQASHCHWQGQLSPQQSEAGARIITALEQHDDILLWAVAGAGKTELIFPGIEFALQQGYRVALACPRVDVILELETRIKAAFPETSIATLHGNSEEKHACAQLVLTTTHQLFRFKNAFEMIVIDEVDAFPFSMDTHLQYAAKTAAKPQATTVYLTATPSREWQRQYFSGERNGYLIPARFHRHPNPVPTMRWIGDWKKMIEAGKLPKRLTAWLMKQSRPFLLFFPDIEAMEKALPLIQQLVPHVSSVHAADPARKEKVDDLRNGVFAGLLTTTILERGITIKAVDVLVIGAENQIFTEAALVQIAGRVGRNPQYPTGEIIFFHYGKTKSMLSAIHHIRRNNQLAKEKGLLGVE